MATATHAVPRRRDWIFANPWAWISAALLACVWALAWARFYDVTASDNRVILLALGLLAAAAAVTLSLRSGQAILLDRLSDAGRRAVSLTLVALFLMQASGMTYVVIDSFISREGAWLYPGLASITWLLLVPVSLAAAWNCWRRLQHGEGPGATEEAALLSYLASLCALIGSYALDLGPSLPGDWDSIRFFLRVVAGAILLGAALLACSTAARRLQISGLILFHFGGIMTATLAAPPTPWVVTQIWTRIYRPYLEFMYLNNAYHFYAPEPGPASYIWARAIYTDKQNPQQKVGVWHKIPRVNGKGRTEHTAALEYQRFLAMTEGTAFPGDAPASVVIGANGQATYAPYLQRRMWATPNSVTVVGIQRPELQIPFDPVIPQAQQYAVPTVGGKQLAESFARHVASLPHPDDAKNQGEPRYEFERVKIYRVVHTIPPSAWLAAGVDALRDPTLFRPFFLGEFNAAGKILEPDDPFLYWLLPILRFPHDGQVQIRNYAALHAGDPRWVRNGDSEEWTEQKN
jgi:hypothetical protein